MPLCLLLHGFGATASALGDKYAHSLERELHIIIVKNPKYVWGGATDERMGLDCSGYLFLACKRAGIPVKRTTSFRMAHGLDGWDSVVVGRMYVASRELDITFWTFKASPNRPYGHVGQLLVGRSGLLEVTHASARRGVVVDKIKGSLLSDLVRVRRLTIGD